MLRYLYNKSEKPPPSDRMISRDADSIRGRWVLIRLFEAARAVVEGRIRPPYGVEVTELHIDMARGVVAEYVIRSEDGEIPVRIVYSPEP